ncbi:MAG: 3-hydroxyacyl-ACP dehydratase FabZ [Flavobacteriales bacterium]|jgi:UDP-3-O-[3-hydroxymyristoyl] N-acetylglucosamine deacetylase/3-hydroxyacyl-[acyl-carrier-protein] dehydratase|uniref:3-hydroxyacyl-ACP dehydratase FabZ n=1 Tax=Blattabacterium sp. (Mastotermes darwiniensis) TaxID=39768 RepID=UPI000231DF1D|nr:3-hydroxyacyl-ACP dehydratase FabZ [Blattabacterium sp. (Mastotermes darwiniensis)]AER40849.1 bifunctional UDP-3-O-[3-hydroxymyristoyl] N-acetylglucosamine deacetylase(lpxC)/(3R)-hydroxymyristoyl-[acyl-carrier-protein] dehydratase(fabZ) [Blattabacterium sp. (Mastotermes darwiniensis) str. MADAR]MDR1804696.1 3-hydroxyacyl-ACP dehydratase FabZ [Flavobacteriales bacterium]
MFDKQKTIGKKISLKGVGLYTEKNVTITFKPAPEHTGFILVRTDIRGNPCIKAHLSLLNETTEKGLILEKNGFEIRTSEHVLAALTGMDLDNVIIELDSIEFPIMDGSSKYFVEAIEKAGIIEQEARREYYSIKEIISYEDPKTGGEIIAIPAKKFEIIIMVDFDSELINTQNAVLKHLDQFKQRIANSRDFCLIYEKEEKYSDDNFFYRKEKSILDNLLSIRHSPSNEVARHYLLDFMGYLTLIGVKLKGKIIAYKPYPHMNTQFSKKLVKNIQRFTKKNIPEFDLTKKPLFDIQTIMKILPHKPPFLLVDKIIELTENCITGVKNVTINEPFFIGHFPKEPIMPGVLQIEAIAQVGGVLVLNKVKNPEFYSPYFLKIDKVKFKHKVVPGDLLVFQVKLLNPIKRGIVHMRGKGYVNNQIVVEAEVMAKIVKNET